MSRRRPLEAAVALLAGASGQARVLAGGTDLLIQMRGGRVEPELIVDIKGIPEMTSIVVDNGAYRFGAAVPCMVLVENKEFGKVWPGVVDGANLIGSIQVRGRATVGGNLCNASPAADTVPAMMAAGAIASIVGPKGRREVPIEDSRHRTGQDFARQGRDRRVVPAAEALAAFRRRVSSLHSAHRDGHRGRRRGGQPHAGRQRAYAPTRGSRSARSPSAL